MIKFVKQLHRAKSISACAALLTALTGHAGIANQADARLDTKVLKTVYLTASQGVGTDGKNLYAFSTDAIRVYDGNCQLTMERHHPFSGLAGYNHLGSGCYYRGSLYVPAENFGPSGNASIFVFSATRLSRLSLTVISNWQAEISAVCVDPDFSNNVTIFASSFPDKSGDGHEANFYQFTLTGKTNIAFVRKIPYLGDAPKKVQGISYYGGMLYVIGDDNDKGDFYQVNPANGRTVFLGQLAVPGANEWEGIDTTLGVLIATANGTGQTMIFNFLPVDSSIALSRVSFITGGSRPKSDLSKNLEMDFDNFVLNPISRTITMSVSSAFLGALLFVQSSSMGTGNKFARRRWTIRRTRRVLQNVKSANPAK